MTFTENHLRVVAFGCITSLLKKNTMNSELNGFIQGDELTERTNTRFDSEVNQQKNSQGGFYTLLQIYGSVLEQKTVI